MTKARDVASQLSNLSLLASGGNWVEATHIEPFSKDLVILRNAAAPSYNLINRSMVLFQSNKTLTISNLSIWISSSNPLASPSYAKLALYTYNPTANTATLVARTANDFTLTSSVGIKTLPLSIDGGYPSTYTLTAGTLYGFVFLSNGTSTATFVGIDFSNIPMFIINSYLTASSSASAIPIGGLATAADTQTPQNLSALTPGSNAFPWFRLS